MTDPISEFLAEAVPRTVVFQLDRYNHLLKSLNELKKTFGNDYLEHVYEGATEQMEKLNFFITKFGPKADD